MFSTETFIATNSLAIGLYSATEIPSGQESRGIQSISFGLSRGLVSIIRCPGQERQSSEAVVYQPLIEIMR